MAHPRVAYGAAPTRGVWRRTHAWHGAAPTRGIWRRTHAWHMAPHPRVVYGAAPTRGMAPHAWRVAHGRRVHLPHDVPRDGAPLRATSLTWHTPP
eukprot:2681943-Prymnesium_polylepis.2